MKVQVLLFCIAAVFGYITTASAQLQRPSKAFKYFSAAAAVVVDDIKLGTELTPEALEQLVKNNHEALSLVRQGFAYDYHQPLYLNDYDQSRFRRQWRSLGLLLAADGDVKAARGDWDAAANAYIDAIKLGGEVTRGGPNIELLVAISTQSLGRRKLAESLPHLSASAAKEATRRMEITLLAQPDFADTLRNEATLSENLFEEGLFAKAEPTFKDQTTQHYRELWTEIISDVGKPYPFLTQAIMFGLLTGDIPFGKAIELNQQVEFPVPDFNRDNPTTVARATFDVILPVTGRVYFSDKINRTQNQLLLTALALQAYRAAHGEYPETLLQLVPTYIEKAPSDLFEVDETLRYKPDGDKYLLYSVGPDGRNDDGKPIHNAGKTGREEYSVRVAGVDAKGDIVFGINN